MKTTILLIFLFALLSFQYATKKKTVDLFISQETIYKVDTIINKGIYQSYFNYHYKEPMFVVYKLYKGGGDCSRNSFRFINDTKISMATSKDYAHNGYDEGHLANSEDFANNCINDELTFRFYNCVPQTANLNRGIWKHWETEIRKESQNDSLLVIAGNLYSNKFMGNNKVGVPDFCWKVVQSLTTKQLIHVFLFTNTDSATCDIIRINEIEENLGYKLPLKN